MVAVLLYHYCKIVFGIFYNKATHYREKDDRIFPLIKFKFILELKITV